MTIGKTWHSPLSGEMLAADTPHSLVGPTGDRWPVVDGIPYLRSNRDSLVAQTLACLDAGASADALVLLLSDQDDWWTGPATNDADLRQLVAHRDERSLRDAMALLNFGPVADYFAHRWSDPTYLAGLALLQAHWNAPRTAFELAGGIGHYAREMARLGTACTSADVVFAKCWLGKHWVAPKADYVVFDAKAAHWPVGKQTFDLVHCQDAFYFLPEQPQVADRLCQAIAPGGLMAIGHLHNADVIGGAFGPAKPANEWRALFPDALVYDEHELRAALLQQRAPKPTAWSADETVEAWSVVESVGEAQSAAGPLSVPDATKNLQANPLLTDGQACWPSERYAKEYGPAATWTNADADTPPDIDRRLVDLPERW